MCICASMSASSCASAAFQSSSVVVNWIQGLLGSSRSRRAIVFSSALNDEIPRGFRSQYARLHPMTIVIRGRPGLSASGTAQLDPIKGESSMALPGMRGTDHLGITVPDLEEADDFFVRVFGAARCDSLGPSAPRWRAE